MKNIIYVPCLISMVALFTGCSTFQPKVIIPQIDVRTQEKVEANSDKIASVLDESIVSIHKLEGDTFDKLEAKNIYQFTVSLANGSENKVNFDPNKQIKIRVTDAQGNLADVKPLVGKSAYEHIKTKMGPGAGDHFLTAIHMLGAVASVSAGNSSSPTASAVNHLDTVEAKAELSRQLAYLSGKKELKPATLNYGESVTGVLVVDLKTAKGNIIEVSIDVGGETHTFEYCRSLEGLYCYVTKAAP